MLIDVSICEDQTETSPCQLHRVQPSLSRAESRDGMVYWCVRPWPILTSSLGSLQWAFKKELFARLTLFWGNINLAAMFLFLFHCTKWNSKPISLLSCGLVHLQLILCELWKVMRVEVGGYIHAWQFRAWVRLCCYTSWPQPLSHNLHFP